MPLLFFVFQELTRWINAKMGPGPSFVLSTLPSMLTIFVELNPSHLDQVKGVSRR